MKAVALDIETTGMGWLDTLLVIGAAQQLDAGPIETSSRQLAQGDLFSQPDTMPAIRVWLQGLLQGADWLVLHNASFDLPYLLRSGLLTAEEIQGRIFDTLIMAATTSPHESMGLAGLCAEYGIEGGPGWATLKAQRGNLAQQALSTVAHYCEQDCAATLRLYNTLQKPIADAGYSREWIAQEGDYCALLARMRCRGMQLDQEFVKTTAESHRQRIGTLMRNILLPAGIRSANGRDDLLAWLKQHGWRPDKLTESGEPCLNEDVLQLAITQLPPADAPVLRAVLDVRGAEKEDSTFLTGLWEQADYQGIIHPNFFAGGTRTWRLSSNSPNAQNFPKHLQEDLFTASALGGSLVMLDYSQAQLRLAAMYAQEQKMALLFSLPDTDIHTATAIALYGKVDGPSRRKEGKSANFAVLFGSGAAGVAANFHLESAVAEQVLADHKRTFPALATGAQEARKRWLERGYLILPYGKRTYLRASDRQRAFVAWNYLIQGAEGTLVEHAMLECEKAGLPPIVSQVHDRLDFDVPPGIDPQEVVVEASAIMARAVPEEIQRRTSPRIQMMVDAKIKRRIA